MLKALYDPETLDPCTRNWIESHVAVLRCRLDLLEPEQELAYESIQDEIDEYQAMLTSNRFDGGAK